MSTDGLYTAPAEATTATLVVCSGTVNGIALVDVSSTTVSVAAAAAAVPATVTGTTTELSVLGAADDGEADLTYRWQATGLPGGPRRPCPAPTGRMPRRRRR